MKKRLFLALTVVLILSILCSIIIGCTKKVDEYENVVKPSIDTALDNYAALDTKKSDFTADLTITLRLKGRDENRNEVINKLFITETLSLTRILNDGKIYVDGKVMTSDVTESFTTSYRSLQNAFGAINKKPYDPNKDDVLRYLEKKSHFGLKLGYLDGSYNLKTSYVDDGKVEHEFWGATDNSSVNALLKNLKVNASVDLSQYLMTTGIVDLTDVTKWLGGDNASKNLSSDTQKFIYNIIGDPEKLHEVAFSYLEKFAGLFGKEDYVDELEEFSQVLPYLKKWITFGPSEVDASVSRDGLPEKMTTSMQVNLNIPQKELDEVLTIVLSEDDKKQLDPFLTIIFLLNPYSTDEKNAKTIGISFDLKLTENFSYGADAQIPADADTDVFIPATEDAKNRKEYIFSAKDE